MNVKPKEAIVALTYRCDARCRMCNIWKKEPKEWLSVEHYARLPNGLEVVNLTGGEALLRKDFVDIANVIYESCGQPRIIISTNGFRSAQSMATLREMRRNISSFGIGVSIDGIGQMHDQIRGVPNAFRRAVETIRALTRDGFTDIRIGFTAMNENLSEMEAVYELSRSLGVEFAATVAQNSSVYYGKVDNESVDSAQLADVVSRINKRELSTNKPKRWFRAYFNHGIVEFVANGTRLAPCRAGLDFFYISPEGFIYPCLSIPEIMGDLRDTTFDIIWNGARANAVRARIRNCQECWMVCTSRSEIKK